MKDLKELLLDLDSELGGIACSVETLTDIETLLSFTKQDMDDGAHKGEEKFYFQYAHREIRVLQKLLYHTLDELNKHYKKAHTICDELNSKTKKEYRKEKINGLSFYRS